MIRHERLSSDPSVCGGKVCIRGTRIPVALILGWLASGMTVDEILADYDTLKRIGFFSAWSRAEA